MSFYKKYKEWIDQPIHFLMGYGLCGGIIWGIHSLSHDASGGHDNLISVPWWWAYPVGILVTRLVWSLREWNQHRKHDHEPRYYVSFDLAFIDGGIAASVITLLLLGNTV